LKILLVYRRQILLKLKTEERNRMGRTWKVADSRVFREIFGPWREELTGS
jgi:hypothetical protein